MQTRLTVILTIISLSAIGQPKSVDNVNEPSLQDVYTIGNQIEESLENNNPAYLNSMIDIDNLFELAIDKPSSQHEKTFYDGFVEGFGSTFDLGTALLDESGSGGSFELLQCQKKGLHYSLLFRLNAASGLNYYEIVIEHSGEAYSINNIYNFYSDESLQDVLRRMYALGNIMSGNQNEKLLASLAPWAMNVELTKLYSRGKYAKVIKKWSQMEPVVRNHKVNLATVLRCAAHLDSEQFSAIFDMFSWQYPESGGKYLLAVEALALQEGYTEELLICADSLERYTGKDPVMDVFRAELCYSMGHVEASRDLLEEAILTMPENEVIYIKLLAVYLDMKDYEKAAGLLDQIEFVFSSYKEDLEPLLVDYPEFLQSPAYANWMEK